MPIDQWLDKEDVEYYSAIKEWNNAICSNMGEPKDYHTKWTKSNRERWVTCNTTYMWNLKKWYKWTYLRNRNRLTDIGKKPTVTEGERGWRNKLWVGINIYTLPYIKWGFPENPSVKQETWVQSLDWEDPLEKGVATHSSILTWRIPWTEKPGRLQSWGHKELDMTKRLTLSRT